MKCLAKFFRELTNRQADEKHINLELEEQLESERFFT